jgi:hypothetical protein
VLKRIGGLLLPGERLIPFEKLFLDGAEALMNQVVLNVNKFTQI